MKETKKRRFKINRLIFVLLIMYLLIYLLIGFFQTKIRNVYIYGNELYNDQKIMELSAIDNYPSCFLTTNESIKRRLLGNPYIKDVIVDKKWFCKIEIKVEEYKVLFEKRNDKKIVLENGKEILSDYNFNNIPILINYVPSEQYEKLINKMKIIDQAILKKISEIEYNPNDVDKERFLLSMNDGNYVYLTLHKYEQINYYLKVLPNLAGKKGIFYWDSGNYFDIIE